MSTMFRRPAKAALGFVCACLAVVVMPGAASAQYTEYVVQAPAPEIPSADDLRDQLLDLIQAQAPTLEALRQQDMQLRDHQQPEIDRLNADVRALIESQREARDALTSQLHRLQDDQQAYLSLHPDASEQELDALRAEMQALKDRQRPVREKMKDDLMALIDHQKPERDALRAERMELREAQRPVREQVLDARSALETKIEYASAKEPDSEDDILEDSGLTSRTAGLPGLEQFGASKTSRTSGSQPFAAADWSKPEFGSVPVKLDRPALPATDAQ